MTKELRLTVSRSAAVASLLLVLTIGAAGMWLIMRQRTGDHGPNAPVGKQPGDASTASSQSVLRGGSSGEVVVSLSKDAIERAGIAVTPAGSRTMANELRLPGVVEPNAYRQVSVTPLVTGRVVRVSVELGARVRRGQSIAQVYSPELAEARTKYLAARAMLDAHDRELQRTQKLVEIGAASRQELERLHAEHAAQSAEVDSARSRLELLGAKADAPAGEGEASATADLRAPIDGIVTERLANVGLNVDPATRLVTIVDLSSVWVIASVYERDLSRVREGARATVTVAAYPDLSLDGRVSYIDPQLKPDTRSAQVRIEVANPRGDLRLGMYADVVIADAGITAALAVPKDAIQNVGEHQVVYLAVPGDATKFIEREVQAGRATGNAVEIVSGLKQGDSVVSPGSFSVRAEVERLGLRSPRSNDAQTAKVLVGEKGYEPARINLRAGTPARITFVRTTDKTCGTDIVFPSLDIRRQLPLNEPVVIEFTPPRAGEIAFVCGMGMLQGAVVVQ